MILRLAAALILFAAPVMATQDQWPALFDVTGVASDDVLNIRAAANASSDIVGTLAPDATDIEVIRPNQREDWGLVNTGEGQGWVSLGFLQRQPGQFAGAYPDVQTCFGTEPFWTLERSDGRLHFTGLDLPEIRAAIGWEAGTIDHRGRFVIAGGGMTGIIEMDACSDGMSDRAFGIGITLAIPDEDRLHHGCCTLAD